jgi:hypothetical protein
MPPIAGMRPGNEQVSGVTVPLLLLGVDFGAPSWTSMGAMVKFDASMPAPQVQPGLHSAKAEEPARGTS